MDTRAEKIQLLSELNKCIDIRLIAEDNLTDFETRQTIRDIVSDTQQKTPKQKIDLPSYSSYVKTVKKLPDPQLFICYLRELKNIFDPPFYKKTFNYYASFTNIFSFPKDKSFDITTTESQKIFIDARKIWSDVVSDTDQYNEKYCDQHSVRQQVIDRLKKIGYIKNTEILYDDCIRYLKKYSAIVVSFDASFLNQNNLSDYQLLNMLEKDTLNKRGVKFKFYREKVEKKLFNHLSPSIKKCLVNNLHARPKYGALLLVDIPRPYGNIYPVTDYGKSYFVLRDFVKFNSLFVPHDSFNSSHRKGVDFLPNSYHHFELLLLQCFENKLRAIAHRVVYGCFPENYNQTTWHDDDPGRSGYIEALLPAINVLDSAFVQHIHIDQNEYHIPEDQKNALKEMGITLTNTYHSPYAELSKEFMKCVEKNDIKETTRLLKIYPSLALTITRRGEGPLQIAGRNEENAKKSFWHFFLSKPKENENKKSPSTSELMWDLLVKNGAGTDNARHSEEYGQTPLIIAARENRLDRLKKLIQTGDDLNVNSIETIAGSKYGHTALTYAAQYGNAEMLNLILSLPQLKIDTINYKNDYSESALFISAKQGDLQKVKMLVNIPGVDLEARCTHASKKTALQIAQDHAHWEVTRELKSALYKQSIYKQTLPEEDRVSQRKKMMSACAIPDQLEEKIKQRITQEEEQEKTEYFKKELFNQLETIFNEIFKHYHPGNSWKSQAFVHLTTLFEKLYQHRSGKDAIEIILGCLISEQRMATQFHHHASHFQKMWSNYSEFALKARMVKDTFIKHLKEKSLDEGFIEGIKLELLQEDDLVQEYEDYLADNKIDTHFSRRP